jgi:hypothetical protein
MVGLICLDKVRDDGCYRGADGSRGGGAASRCSYTRANMTASSSVGGQVQHDISAEWLPESSEEQLHLMSLGDRRVPA